MPNLALFKGFAKRMFSHFFLTGEIRDWMILTSMAYTYDYWLVLLSGLVAIFASVTTFYLIGNVKAAADKPVGIAWLAASTVTMGSGIWSMHFIAMLAM